MNRIQTNTQPGIEQIFDLNGKTIGCTFGSLVELTCRLLPKKHLLDPGTDVKLFNLEVGDVPAVFCVFRY